MKRTLFIFIIIFTPLVASLTVMAQNPFNDGNDKSGLHWHKFDVNELISNTWTRLPTDQEIETAANNCIAKLKETREGQLLDIQIHSYFDVSWNKGYKFHLPQKSKSEIVIFVYERQEYLAYPREGYQKYNPLSLDYMYLQFDERTDSFEFGKMGGIIGILPSDYNPDGIPRDTLLKEFFDDLTNRGYVAGFDGNSADAPSPTADATTQTSTYPNWLQLPLPGLRGIGLLPGPNSTVEAIVGVVAPGLIAVLGGLLSGLFGNPLPAGMTPVVPSAGDPSQSADFSPEAGSGSPSPDAIEQTSPAPDIAYTYPDGRSTMLVYNPEHGGYINQLTGGLVDPSNIEGWKQKNEEIQYGVDDFRKRDAALAATHQDAQSQALQAIKDQAAARDKLFQNLSTMEKGVLFGNIGAGDLYKSRGEPGNILDRIKVLRGQLTDDKTFDKDKYERVRTVYGDARSGKTMTEDRLPTSNETTRDIINDTVGNTVKEAVTGKKEDGSTSWLGIGGRALTAAVTGGASELVLTPTSALCTMKDYVDKGGDSVWDGFKAATKEVVIGEAIGRGVQMGGAILGAGSTMVKEIVKDAAGSGNSVAKRIVSGVNAIKNTAAGTKEAISDTLSAAGDKVKGLIDNVKNSLSTGGKSVPLKVYGTSSVGAVGKRTADVVSKAEASAASAEGKAASATAKPAASAPKGALAVKTVSAADVAANKAARANARVSQMGDGKYAVKADPKVNVDKQMAGMTSPAKKQLQMECDKFGVKIDARSTTKYAHDPIAQGKAVPKPEYVKAKTISPEDVKLGAKEENLGLVGYFKPQKPVRGNMSSEEYDNLMKRYNQRTQEFKDNWDHMVELKQKGQAHVKGGVVIDTKTGKPYTGDYDLFDIRDAVTGKPLPRYQIDPKGNVMFNLDGTPKLNPVRQQILKDLQQPPFNAQHGCHMDWKYDHVSKEVPQGAPAGARSEFEMKQGIDKTILGKHKSAPDGDAIITLGADQKPSGGWFEGDR